MSQNNPRPLAIKVKLPKKIYLGVTKKMAWIPQFRKFQGGCRNAFSRPLILPKTFDQMFAQFLVILTLYSLIILNEIFPDNALVEGYFIVWIKIPSARVSIEAIV